MLFSLYMKWDMESSAAKIIEIHSKNTELNFEDIFINRNFLKHPIAIVLLKLDPSHHLYEILQDIQVLNSNQLNY